jgi:hypothetical protein
MESDKKHGGHGRAFAGRLLALYFASELQATVFIIVH